MATLHMEVETASSVQKVMKNSRGQLQYMLQSLTSSVNELPSAWMGNSATEFLNEYEQWKDNMLQSLDELDQMAKKLDIEIEDWKNQASKLA